MTQMPPEPTTAAPANGDVVLYCANHPKVETSLRCNNCSKPICPRCAKLTPTGYRCKECISGQQRTFDTSLWYDYPVAFIISVALSFGGSLLASEIGWFMIFLAPILGVVAAEIVRFAIRRRRSKQLYQVAAIGVALGALPMVLLVSIGLFFPEWRGYSILNLVWQVIYAFTITSSFYYRLGGINMR